jgi:hypothetical protein
MESHSHNTVLAVKVGEPVLDCLRLCYEAGRPVMLQGGTGVGKSEILRQFAESKKIGFISRDLSLMEPPDLVGMPELKDGRTHFRSPAFLPTEGKGVFVLEEINRAPEYMRAPCLQLLTDRSLNDYRLPAGWLPVASINPAEDGYDAAELDPAMLSRFVQLTVVPSQSCWLAWAKEHGVHKAVLNYVDSEPDVFGSVRSNPRSWTYVSDLMHAGDEQRTNGRLLLTMIAGCVGPDRARAFLAFTKNATGRPLKANEVLQAYQSHRAKVLSWISDGRTDLLETSLRNVEKRIQAGTDFGNVRASKKLWENLRRFLHDLPGDLAEQATQFFRERRYEFPMRRTVDA